MNEKSKGIYFLLKLINFPFFLLWVFFSCATILIFFFSISYWPYFILLQPMIGVVFITFHYLRPNNPLESLNQLILINITIFLLYLTFFSVLVLVLINPLKTTNFILYEIVLSLLYYFYFILLVPLIGFILLTIIYLKINIPISRKKLLIISMSTTSIIMLFIIIYPLLNWAVPFLDNIFNDMYFLD